MRFRLRPAIALLAVSSLIGACSEPAETPEAAISAPGAEDVTEEPLPVPPLPPEPAVLSALAQMPGPAAGKWLYDTEIDGRPLLPAESCLRADSLAAFTLPAPEITCRDQMVVQEGEVVKIHLECKTSSGSPLVIDYTITGDFGSAYDVEKRQKFADPSPAAPRVQTVTTRATRLGDC